MVNLIGLMGAAGAGKDTAAICITTSLQEFRQDYFALPLYEALAAILGTTVSHLQKREVKDKPWPTLGVTPRRMLQTLGTDWGRDLIDMDIWLKLAAERHRVRSVRFNKRTVISDVRFPNEAKWIRDSGGVLIRITRQLDDPVETHVSELALDDCTADYTIGNTGTFDELRRALLAVIS